MSKTYEGTVLSIICKNWGYHSSVILLKKEVYQNKYNFN